jgi:ElaB/YqjD/DUF883 family membrane-anchored ribosome-binding protein
MVNQRVSGSATSASRTRAAGSPTGQAAQAAQQVSETARQTVTQATETARQQADRQLDKVSQGLEQFAQTMHQTGDTLQQNEQAALGQYVHKAAGQVERASDYLRVSSVNDIIDDVQSYARREPVVALSVAVGLGFIAARLLKASMKGTSGSGQYLAYQTSYQPPFYGSTQQDQSHYPTPGTGTVGNRYGNGA